MNEQVIEAAEAAHNAYFENEIPARPGLRTEDYERLGAMEAAITAADTARAPAVIAALNAYVTALNQHAGTALLCGPRLTAGSEERVREARRAVLAAAGVVEEPTP